MHEAELDPTTINTASLPCRFVATDAMTLAAFDIEQEKRWNIQVVPYGFLAIHPGESQLHTPETVIARMILYKGQDGDVYAFRPGLHLARTVRDFAQIGFERASEEILAAMLAKQAQADKRWIPRMSEKPADRRYYVGLSGYPRVRGPRLVSSDISFQIQMIGAPMGRYKPHLIKVGILAERPVVDGLGEYKFGSHYPASVRHMRRNYGDASCDECLFINRNGIVQEGCSANIFLAIGKKGKDGKDLIVAASEPNILQGITRQSFLELAERIGMEAREEEISFNDLSVELKDPKAEAFMTGTAMSGLCQVGELVKRESNGDLNTIYYCGSDITSEKLGPISAKLQRNFELILQRKHPDNELNDWMQKVD